MALFFPCAVNVMAFVRNLQVLLLACDTGCLPGAISHPIMLLKASGSSFSEGALWYSSHSPETELREFSSFLVLDLPHKYKSIKLMKRTPYWSRCVLGQQRARTAFLQHA